MSEVLKKVKDIKTSGCVTILINTHRTLPDYQKDGIKLKNAIKEAKSKLEENFDKKEVTKIVNNLERIENNIEHSHNLDALAVFANDEISEFERLPFKVEQRTVVNDHFAIRDLVRQLNYSTDYYVFVLTREQARLIEANDSKVVKELTSTFPIENENEYEQESHVMHQYDTDPLIDEFFARVDKQLMKVYYSKPKPIVIATEKRNYARYMKFADNKNVFIGHFNFNINEPEANIIIENAYNNVIKEYKDEIKSKALNKLEQTRKENRVIDKPEDIWKALKEGNGSQLIVERDLFLKSKMNGEYNIEIISEDENVNGNVNEDVVDDMIEMQLNIDGDVTFVDSGELEKYQGIALITRY